MVTVASHKNTAAEGVGSGGAVGQPRSLMRVVSAGESGISIPSIPKGDLIQASKADEDLLSSLEHAVADWTRVIQTALLDEAQKVPQGPGGFA